MTGRATPDQILQSRGISWPQGASAFYNRGSSQLVVTNTRSNMELVDAFVESIQEEIVKQVETRVKFLEIRQDNTEELGFDWLLNGFGIKGNDRVIAGGGTLGNSRGNFGTEQAGGYNVGQVPFFETGLDANDVEVTAPYGINPVTGGLRSGSQGLRGNALDSLVADLPRGQAEALSPAPGIISVAGIFTDPQFQVIMRGLNQHKAVDLMTAPTVVTKSAQAARIEVIRELIYPIEFDPPELPQEVTLLGGGGVFPVTPSHPTTFETRHTGVTLEVNPQVGPDSYTIDLSLAPEVVEFDGFVNYGSEITAAGTDLLGNPTQIVVTDNRIDLPIFSTRRAVANVTVYDGFTVALGGLIREDVQEVHDKVPIVGDLPYVGRLFRSTTEQHLRRNLVIFVTARLIDPRVRPSASSWKARSAPRRDPSSKLHRPFSGIPGTIDQSRKGVEERSSIPFRISEMVVSEVMDRAKSGSPAFVSRMASPSRGAGFFFFSFARCPAGMEGFLNLGARASAALLEGEGGRFPDRFQTEAGARNRLNR